MRVIATPPGGQIENSCWKLSETWLTSHRHKPVHHAGKSPVNGPPMLLGEQYTAAEECKWAEALQCDSERRKEGHMIGSACVWMCRLPEGLSHRAHTEHYVQVVPDSLYQVAEHGLRSLHHVVFPGRVWQGVAHLEVDRQQLHVIGIQIDASCKVVPRKSLSHATPSYLFAWRALTQAVMMRLSEEKKMLIFNWTTSGLTMRK